MQRVHMLTVIDPVVSVWVPSEKLDDASASTNADTVIEIHFKYREEEDIGRPVTRYFPENNFDQIYGYFRQHFPEERKMEGVTRRKGYFLADNAVPYLRK